MGASTSTPSGIQRQRTSGERCRYLVDSNGCSGMRRSAQSKFIAPSRSGS